MASLTLLLVMPASTTIIFDGIPLASWQEISILGGLFFLFGYSNIRNGINETLNKLGHKRFRWILYCLCALAVVKFATFLIFPTAGEYEVCYHAVSIKLETECERTFEPLPVIASRSVYFDRRSTSVDQIQFGPRSNDASGISQSNWRLPMINSRTFDEGWWMWNGQDRNIEIFPFDAEFRGDVEIPSDSKLRIGYVGEGSVEIGGDIVLLPPSYGSERILVIDAAPGIHRIRVNFSFLRTQTYNDISEMPYATLGVNLESKDESRPLVTERPLLLGVVGWLIDASIVLTLLLAVGTSSRIRGEAVKTLSIGVSVLGGIWIGSNFPLRDRFPIEVSILVTILFTLTASIRRWPTSRLLVGYVIAAVDLVRNEFSSATGLSPDIGQILVRLRGNDHLVYHGLVREMLESGFLRGGEVIYHFQPGIRYYFFLQNVIFGESSFITGAMSVAVIGLGISVISKKLYSNSQLTRAAQHMGVVGLLIWWSSSHTTQSTVYGLSEFGSWIALLAIAGLLLDSTSTWKLVAIGALAGIGTWIRPNQGVAMLCLVWFALTNADGNGFRKQSLLPAFCTWLGVLLLIPLHNLYFGGVLRFQPTGALAAAQLTWSELTQVFSRAETREFLLNNLKAISYLPIFLRDIYSYRLALGFMVFIVSTILIVLGSWRRNIFRITFLIGASVVAGQVLPFLKYSVVRYHPIQVVAIHLSLILMALLVSNEKRSSQETSAINH